MKPALLTVELVPRTAWYSNVRSAVTSTEWEKCKRFVAERSGRRCEVCGGRGPKWPIEAHEIWEYDDETLTQRLAGLIALCPDCHSVKHVGRAEAVGRLDRAFKHLCRVNGWPAWMAEAYLEDAFENWARRSNYEWTCDMSYLDEIGVSLRVARR